MRLGSFPRSSGYEMSTFVPLPASNRSSFGIDHPINYEEESTAYNSQPSPYMFPNTQQGVLADYCGIAWNPKAWSSNLQVNKASSGALFTSQDTENSFATSSYPYLFSGQVAQSTDVPPVVPTIPCIPPDGQGADRTLPNPTGRDQLQIGLSCLTTASDTIHGLPMSPEYRFGNSLATRGPISSGSRPSVQLSSTGSLCGGSPVQTTRASQPSAQDMVFDYLPLTSAGSSSHLVSPGGAVPAYEPLEPSDDFRGSESRVARSFSRDSGRFISLMGCSSDVYGYSSSSEKIKNRSETSDTGSGATLMNGLPYTRPRHADSHTTIPFDLLTTDVLSDYRGPTEMHRPSVSALSNPGGF
ncbi:uncharacterized protein ACLA_065370 [Aspergillus clavatus NRRL 1]|uniref:Streptococcal hemagglutinin protein, putative n=1 Tax=Aspergillus clavatus (strain ATCC 1007 / CBS 513.65 / DSM 816 / NCTC 3887 / NRRL 1 / QM 1276 / 107) TaxID=344612 RepID=A1CG23_ASPCL|nr:streptococcal hemagglutinin protein, putative [Aspergillus clavatus NRRL 1]EAW10903.1 streptococcal hemagglutinin protein, putative [Aspergillus clavatus NRRL 1]